MAKKVVLTLLIASVGCGVGFSQEGKAKNTVSGGINYQFFVLGGAELQYERMLGNVFSIGIESGTELWVIPFVLVHGRWYPWGKTFYADLGLGVSYIIVPTIAPGIGWKFDVGAPNAWNIDLGIAEPLLISMNGVFSASFPKINIRFGYSF